MFSRLMKVLRHSVDGESEENSESCRIFTREECSRLHGFENENKVMEQVEQQKNSASTTQSPSFIPNVIDSDVSPMLVDNGNDSSSVVKNDNKDKGDEDSVRSSQFQSFSPTVIDSVDITLLCLENDKLAMTKCTENDNKNKEDEGRNELDMCDEKVSESSQVLDFPSVVIDSGNIDPMCAGNDNPVLGECMEDNNKVKEDDQDESNVCDEQEVDFVRSTQFQEFSPYGIDSVHIAPSCVENDNSVLGECSEDYDKVKEDDEDELGVSDEEEVDSIRSSQFLNFPPTVVDLVHIAPLCVENDYSARAKCIERGNQNKEDGNQGEPTNLDEHEMDSIFPNFLPSVIDSERIGPMCAGNNSSVRGDYNENDDQFKKYEDQDELDVCDEQEADSIRSSQFLSMPPTVIDSDEDIGRLQIDTDSLASSESDRETEILRNLASDGESMIPEGEKESEISFSIFPASSSSSCSGVSHKKVVSVGVQYDLISGISQGVQCDDRMHLNQSVQCGPVLQVSQAVQCNFACLCQGNDEQESDHSEKISKLVGKDMESTPLLKFVDSKQRATLMNHSETNCKISLPPVLEEIDNVNVSSSQNAMFVSSSQTSCLVNLSEQNNEPAGNCDSTRSPNKGKSDECSKSETTVRNTNKKEKKNKKKKKLWNIREETSDLSKNLNPIAVSFEDRMCVDTVAIGNGENNSTQEKHDKLISTECQQPSLRFNLVDEMEHEPSTSQITRSSCPPDGGEALTSRINQTVKRSNCSTWVSKRKIGEKFKCTKESDKEPKGKRTRKKTNEELHVEKLLKDMKSTYGNSYIENENNTRNNQKETTYANCKKSYEIQEKEKIVQRKEENKIPHSTEKTLSCNSDKNSPSHNSPPSCLVGLDSMEYPNSFPWSLFDEVQGLSSEQSLHQNSFSSTGTELSDSSIDHTSVNFTDVSMKQTNSKSASVLSNKESTPKKLKKNDKECTVEKLHNNSLIVNKKNEHVENNQKKITTADNLQNNTTQEDDVEVCPSVVEVLRPSDESSPSCETPKSSLRMCSSMWCQPGSLMFSMDNSMEDSLPHSKLPQNSCSRVGGEDRTSIVDLSAKSTNCISRKHTVSKRRLVEYNKNPTPERKDVSADRSLSASRIVPYSESSDDSSPSLISENRKRVFSKQRPYPLEQRQGRSGTVNKKGNGKSDKDYFDRKEIEKKHCDLQGDTNDSQNNSDSDDDDISIWDSWNSTVTYKRNVSRTTVGRTFRKPYTHAERETIVWYIVDHKYYNLWKGTVIWKKMERSGVCPNRTWQSLKEHFRKQILPHIEDYKLPDSILNKFRAVMP